MAQNSSIYAITTFESGQKLSRGLDDSGRDDGGGTGCERHSAADKGLGHGRMSRENRDGSNHQALS